MTQQESGQRSAWGRVLVVIPTLSGSQAKNVATLEEQFRSVGAWVAVIANGQSAANALEAGGSTPLNFGRNLGFAGAVNRGRESHGNDLDWILVINDDVTIESLLPFALMDDYNSTPTIVTFGPEPSRPIPRAGSTFAALAMIPLGRVGSHDPTGVPFPLPKGRYTPFSVVAVQRALWDDLNGLDERFPFMYEDADFARRAELAGAQRIAVHTPSEIRHARGVSGRRNVRAVFPTVTSSALQYLIKWGLQAPLARAICIVGLLCRIPLLPLSRAPLGEHFLAVVTAIGVAAGVQVPSLPRFEDS